MIVFLISGLWHGAGWAFAVYGFVNGIALCYEFVTSKFRKKMAKKIPLFLYNKVSILLTLCFVVFSLVFFRSPTLTDAFAIIGKIGTLNHTTPFAWEVGPRVLSFNGFSWVVSIIGILVLFISENYISVDLKNFNLHPKVDVAFSTLILTLILIFGIFNQSAFIYFQF
jgi:hypothetical protein